ncbi:MAG: hypothetical protein GY862_09120 [Gammaproteobacteria bacterium]|nr:hypothetical protein [Gammaproteobacteria bacterium]
MDTAETIYQKIKMLDTHTLLEVADFIDFLLSQHHVQKMQEEMRQYFPAREFEPPDQKPVYTTTTLSIEEMDAAVEYEAGKHK